MSDTEYIKAASLLHERDALRNEINLSLSALNLGIGKTLTVEQERKIRTTLDQCRRVADTLESKAGFMVEARDRILEEAARLCDAADKSTSPTDLAESIRALKTL